MSKKIFYDFIEIGTSNFDTIIEKCPEDSRGISVEPLKEYLDQLPNKKGVLKLNCAITHNKQKDFALIYFIPEKIIDKKGLPNWLKGCNSIECPHHHHKDLMDIVKKRTVPLLNINELLDEYNVGKIGLIKIDAEGHETSILEGMLEYLENKPLDVFPDKIQFEGPMFIDLIYGLIKKFKDVGYEIEPCNEREIEPTNQYVFTLSHQN